MRAFCLVQRSILCNADTIVTPFRSAFPSMPCESSILAFSNEPAAAAQCNAASLSVLAPCLKSSGTIGAGTSRSMAALLRVTCLGSKSLDLRLGREDR